MAHGITFRTVTTPEDFALFTYADGVMESPFYGEGQLVEGAGPFFPELFLDLALSYDLSRGLPDRDTVLIRGEGSPVGWELVVDRYGYLEFRSLHDDPITFRVTTPLTTFASGTFRLALALANVCYTWRDSFWWREALIYSRVCLLGASQPERKLRPLGEWQLEAPDLCPVPESIAFPEESWVTGARAYNTVRHELFDRAESSAGPSVDDDFPDSSRVYGFHDAGTDTLDLFIEPAPQAPPDQDSPRDQVYMYALTAVVILVLGGITARILRRPKVVNFRRSNGWPEP